MGYPYSLGVRNPYHAQFDQGRPNTPSVEARLGFGILNHFIYIFYLGTEFSPNSHAFILRMIFFKNGSSAVTVVVSKWNERTGRALMIEESQKHAHRFLIVFRKLKHFLDNLPPRRSIK